MPTYETNQLKLLLLCLLTVSAQNVCMNHSVTWAPACRLGGLYINTQTIALRCNIK